MTPLVRTSQAALALAMALTATTAWSDDAALYDKAAPADAVFVRVLSDHANSAQPVSFGGAQLPVSAGDLDTYVAISAADLTGVIPGAYYSIADTGEGPVTIIEPARETAAKVHLILLNTGPDAVRLVVPGKGLEVVAALNPGQAASRAVNPINVALAVERASDGAILGTFDVSLSRGRNLTFVAGASSARMIENTTGPVLTLN